MLSLIQFFILMALLTLGGYELLHFTELGGVIREKFSRL
jgi:hypothetical protein